MEGVNQEIRNRIRISVAAYAYEYKDDPIMSDENFDKLANIYFDGDIIIRNIFLEGGSKKNIVSNVAW